MIFGQYEAKITDKQQVALPKKFREILGKNLVVTKGIENYLIIVEKSKWELLLEGTDGKPFTDKNARQVQRFLLGNATEVNLDDKGRFVIPSYLRDYAGVKKDVVIAGVRNFIELWDHERWEKQQSIIVKDIENITTALSKDS
jgi:MraZ protein